MYNEVNSQNDGSNVEMDIIEMLGSEVASQEEIIRLKSQKNTNKVLFVTFIVYLIFFGLFILSPLYSLLLTLKINKEISLLLSLGVVILCGYFIVKFVNRR